MTIKAWQKDQLNQDDVKRREFKMQDWQFLRLEVWRLQLALAGLLEAKNFVDKWVYLDFIRPAQRELERRLTKLYGFFEDAGQKIQKTDLKSKPFQSPKVDDDDVNGIDSIT